MSDFSKTAILIVLVGSLLVTSFNSFLVILEDHTVVSLVEELPDNDGNSSEKEAQKKDVKTFDGHVFQLQQIVELSPIIHLQDSSEYNSVYLQSITPPPEMA